MSKVYTQCIGTQIRSIAVEEIACDFWYLLYFMTNTDFKQIELRLLAHLTNDEGLKEMFKPLEDGLSKDVFIQLTAQWYGLSFTGIFISKKKSITILLFCTFYISTKLWSGINTKMYFQKPTIGVCLWTKFKTDAPIWMRFLPNGWLNPIEIGDPAWVKGQGHSNAISFFFVILC